MLRSLKDLERYDVSATDGGIGSVANFLLDDERWAVRYLVVEFGLFSGGLPVLISPISFRQADWSTHHFHLALTMDQIKRSPGVDVDQPVSRQHEQDFHRHYGYPYYWGLPGLWGMDALPGSLAAAGWDEPLEGPVDETGDVHLRSAREVRGYRVEGRDDAVGHVADFVVDDTTWEVRYLVMDTGNWWRGKKVLIAPRWASRVNWADRSIAIDISREAIGRSPAWEPDTPINREYEARLYDFYGRPVYWGDTYHPMPAEPQARSDSHPG